MDMGMGSMLTVSVTHTRLRVSGTHPSSVCLAKLTISRAAHIPLKRSGNDGLVNLRYIDF
jgi:hypothetical protein